MTTESLIPSGRGTTFQFELDSFSFLSPPNHLLRPPTRRRLHGKTPISFTLSLSSSSSVFSPPWFSTLNGALSLSPLETNHPRPSSPSSSFHLPSPPLLTRSSPSLSTFPPPSRWTRTISSIRTCRTRSKTWLSLLLLLSLLNLPTAESLYLSSSSNSNPLILREDLSINKDRTDTQTTTVMTNEVPTETFSREEEE